MPIVAEVVDAVIGADTHRDTHTLEMCTPTGGRISSITVANTDTGFTEALTWIAEQAPGARVAAGLEGTRSYGVGLARVLAAAGLQVIEVEQPRRADRRGQGKSDPIDAHLAALSVLRREVDTLSAPRADGAREGLRILLGARRSLVTTQTGHVNQLRALLLGGDDADRALARGTLPGSRLAGIARRRGTQRDSCEQVIRRRECRRLALAIIDSCEQVIRRRECRRLALAIIDSRAELAENKAQLAELVDAIAPGLLDLPGVGPVSAAQVIVSWSHPGRCRDEAAFAALAGACPRPASSGRTIRHRLNRGGDRDLNRALHDIVKTRWRICPRTHDYIERRRAEGKNDPEIRRCLKRYVARELHRELTQRMA